MANNGDVAHAWAHGLDKCCLGSNFSHYNGVLKSYSTCIGQLIRINCNDIYICDYNSYSNTTSKHQGYMFSAIPNDAAVFAANEQSWGRSRFIWNPNDSDELVRFGLEMFLKSFQKAMNIKGCNSIDNEVYSDNDCDKFNKWVRLTGCTTIKKLMSIPAKKWNINVGYGKICDHNMLSKFKRFVKMCLEGCDVDDIIIAMSGKKAWVEYQKRIESALLRQKNTKLTRYLKCLSKNERSYNYQKVTFYNDIVGITKLVRKKHAGDWFNFLVRLKNQNEITYQQINDECKRTKNTRLAKERLERFLGIVQRYSIINIKEMSYNGKKITLSHEWVRDHSISYSEYNEFSKLSGKEKEAWIYNKREELYEAYSQDHAAWVERNAALEEERKETERDYEQIRLNREHYDDLSKTIEGRAQLFREGYRVSLYNIPATLSHGGNVILRLKNGVVETSKGIKIVQSECKRLWELVKRWHKSEREFVAGEDKAHATLSDFTISRFQNDIMVAGCHAIAYCEMENIAKQLGFEL